MARCSVCSFGMAALGAVGKMGSRSGAEKMNCNSKEKSQATATAMANQSRAVVEAEQAEGLQQARRPRIEREERTARTRHHAPPVVSWPEPRGEVDSISLRTRNPKRHEGERVG